MYTNHTPYALGPEDGEAFWGLDNSLLTFKATARQAGGGFSLVEEVAPRGEGTPLHVHREDEESFYILEGKLTFYFGEGGEPTPASVGSFIHIPGGAVHAFRVDSETARYLIITTPQHERFYRAISEPARTRTLPRERPLDMEKVEAACQKYGVVIVAPPPGAHV